MTPASALSLFRLDGRIAFVSGAAGHLGRAMARALAEAGAHVILNGRDECAASRFRGRVDGRWAFRGMRRLRRGGFCRGARLLRRTATRRRAGQQRHQHDARSRSMRSSRKPSTRPIAAASRRRSNAVRAARTALRAAACGGGRSQRHQHRLDVWRGGAGCAALFRAAAGQSVALRSRQGGAAPAHAPSGGRTGAGKHSRERAGAGPIPAAAGRRRRSRLCRPAGGENHARPHRRGRRNPRVRCSSSPPALPASSPVRRWLSMAAGRRGDRRLPTVNMPFLSSLRSGRDIAYPDSLREPPAQLPAARRCRRCGAEAAAGGGQLVRPSRRHLAQARRRE